jgi:hypothetical protein
MRSVIAWLGVLVWALSARTAPATETPAATGPIVVELFTSQGCSSCPPADELLGELARQPALLPLAFHVTYWDDLGWRDRFGLDEADDRQSRYARVLRRNTVYTPQMVVNGRTNVLGSDRAAVRRVLSAAAAPARIDVRRDNDALDVQLPTLAAGCDCELLLLAILPAARTAVGRGENAGRELPEFNVVRQVQSLGSWRGQSLSRRVSPKAVPADATRFAVVAQHRLDLRIVAAGLSGP